MKIKIHNTTYIFLLISFLAGYFEYMYILLLIIFIHETGHYLFALINNIKISNITIYPFGGVTNLDCDLNISIKKEFMCLIGGIIFQILFFLFIRFLYIENQITTHIYELNKEINILLISFNFLPILPLDGGKLINVIFDKIIPYKISHTITIIISIIFTIIFILTKRTILSVILSLMLLNNIYEEYKIRNYKFNKLLLERYLKKYKFKKIKIINKIDKINRDKYHIIDNKFESDYLSKMFDKSR